MILLKSNRMLIIFLNDFISISSGVSSFGNKIGSFAGAIAFNHAMFCMYLVTSLV
jgi:hypothetical protein